MQKKIPALRFPEFNGEWEKKKLGEVSDFISKGTTPSRFVNEGIKFIKLECFDGDKINSNKCLFIDEKTHNKELKRSILQENDLLFAIAGATIGKVNFVPKEILPANTNQALAIIRLKENENRNYIFQILKSNRMQKYITDSISVGAQPNLNLEQMNNFSFFYPSLPEQTKIAEFFTAIDTKIQALKTKKEKLQQYKKGVMQQLFLQTLRFKDETGKEFPEWEMKKLGEICDKIGDGLHGTPIYSDSSDIYFINGNNLINGKIEINENTKTVDYKTFMKNNKELNKNTVLISINGTIGNIAKYNNEKIMLGKSVGYFNFKTNTDFYYHLLNSEIIQNYFISELTGSTIKNLSLKTLRETIIDFPSLPEQTKIANFLSSIDEKINHTETQIQQTQIWKKGLLQKMFV